MITVLLSISLLVKIVFIVNAVVNLQLGKRKGKVKTIEGMFWPLSYCHKPDKNNPNISAVSTIQKTGTKYRKETTHRFFRSIN